MVKDFLLLVRISKLAYKVWIITACDKSGNGIAWNISFDWQGPGWYRFVDAAGTMMPTQAVAQNHCGGHGTGWLNGSYPGISDGIVSRQVCFNIGKVTHPKYYKHFKEAAQESHLGR